MPEPVRYLTCKRGFMVAGGRVVRAGQTIRSDDPLVKGREHEFEPLEGVVESATRAPGEKRVLPPQDRSAVISGGGPTRSAKPPAGK